VNKYPGTLNINLLKEEGRVHALLRRCREIASGRLEGHIEHRTFDEFAAARGLADSALEDLRQAALRKYSKIIINAKTATIDLFL
jgi:hypothetical protein